MGYRRLRFRCLDLPIAQIFELEQEQTDVLFNNVFVDEQFDGRRLDEASAGSGFD